jgi:hypothetical protein
LCSQLQPITKHPLQSHFLPQHNHLFLQGYLPLCHLLVLYLLRQVLLVLKDS